jgi:replicative DNA helicase
MERILSFDRNTLDSFIEKIQPSELSLIYADWGRYNRGTFVLREMLKTLCFDRKIPVLLFCNEFEKDELLEDLVPPLSDVPRNIIQCLEYEKSAQYITAGAKEKVLAAKEIIQEAPLNIEVVERLPIREVCERAIKLVSEKQIKIIFVLANLAYMEDIVGDDRDCNLDEMYDKIETVSKGMRSYRVNTLKNLAREMNLPVVLLTNFEYEPEGKSYSEILPEIELSLDVTSCWTEE